MTRAYGTKPLIIKGAYVLAFALGVAFIQLSPDARRWLRVRPGILLGLGVLSLILINAQGVTALTSERGYRRPGSLAGDRTLSQAVHLRQALRSSL